MPIRSFSGEIMLPQQPTRIGILNGPGTGERYPCTLLKGPPGAAQPWCI
jgi:hypothetical protein